MRTVLVAASVALTTLATLSSAHAQSRVSIEIGGAVSAYDFGNPGSPGSRSAAVRTPNSSTPVVDSTNNSVQPRSLGSGIAAVEIRPTIMTDRGFVLAVGFRIGQAGLGDNGTALAGGDVSLGFQHRFGPFVPFVKALFGFNTYDTPGGLNHSQTDLRADAVLGTRLYVSRTLFLAASAFAGYGDRYGAAVAVGGDVLQFYRRGALR